MLLCKLITIYCPFLFFELDRCVTNFTPQRFISRKEPLISIEMEDGWAPEQSGHMKR